MSQLHKVVVAGLVVAVLGCSAQAGTEPTVVNPVSAVKSTATPASSAVSANLASTVGGVAGLVDSTVSGLVVCGLQPLAHAEAVIGPLGGTINVGQHRLLIPAGALSNPVRIIADAPRDSVASVRFSPEGLQFNRLHPPILTLSYQNCGLLNVKSKLPLKIDYVTEKLKILELLPSIDNPLLMRVTAPIVHFSRYAVAW